MLEGQLADLRAEDTTSDHDGNLGAHASSKYDFRINVLPKKLGASKRATPFLS